MISTLTIPIQLVCQLITPGNINGGNTTSVAGGSVLNQTVNLPTGFTAFPEIGMAYRYFDTEVSWNEARKTCIAHDSNLAEIDSIPEFYAARVLAGIPMAGAFIGVHKRFGDGEWLSLKTGLPVTNLPWVTDAQTSNPAKDCAVLRVSSEDLLPLPCSDKRNFFCEVPLPVN